MNRITFTVISFCDMMKPLLRTFFPPEEIQKTFKAYQIMRHLSSNNIMSWGPCSVCTEGHDMIILTVFHVLFFE